MSYIRFAWGLEHVKGASDSYVIQSTTEKGKDYIIDYGFGDLGMMELLCQAIDVRWRDDPLFADWLKKKVAARLAVELREKPINFAQSMQILNKEIDPKTLKRVSKKEREAHKKEFMEIFGKKTRKPLNLSKVVKKVK